MSPIQQCDVPDALDELGARAGTHLLHPLVTLRAVHGAHAHLDQLVALERPLDLGEHCLAEARGAGEHDRFAVMAESAQRLSLR